MPSNRQPLKSIKMMFQIRQPPTLPFPAGPDPHPIPQVQEWASSFW